MNTGSARSHAVAESPVREFSLDKPYRRAAWWAILGCLLIAAVAWLIQPLVVQRGPLERTLLPAMMVVIALWTVQYLLPRIRIDEEGISRRILWWWDLWPWDSFSSGQVKWGVYRQSYEQTARPWWRRRLVLELLSKEDAARIDQLIRRVWTPPKPELVPESIQIEFSGFGRRSLGLNSEGLVDSRKHTTRAYRWRDVTGVVIWRLEADRPAFRELTLRFGDEELRLSTRPENGAESGNWTGASSAAITSMLMRHVGSERIRDYALFGTARTVEEIDARVAREEQRRKELISGRRYLTAIVLIGLVLLFGVPWLKLLTMGLMYGSLIFAMHWMFHDWLRDVDQRCRQHEAERAKLLAADESRRSKVYDAFSVAKSL